MSVTRVHGHFQKKQLFIKKQLWKKHFIVKNTYVLLPRHFTS